MVQLHDAVWCTAQRDHQISLSTEVLWLHMFGAEITCNDANHIDSMVHTFSIILHRVIWMWTLHTTPALVRKIYQHQSTGYRESKLLGSLPSRSERRPWCAVSHWHGAYVGDCWFSCCYLAATTRTSAFCKLSTWLSPNAFFGLLVLPKCCNFRVSHMIHTVSPMAKVETCFNLVFLAEYHPSIWIHPFGRSFQVRVAASTSSFGQDLLEVAANLDEATNQSTPNPQMSSVSWSPNCVVTVVRLPFLKAHQFSLFWFVPSWSGTSLTWQRSDCKWRKLWEAQEDYQNGWSQDDFSPLELAVFRHHRQSQYAQ